MNEVVEKSVWLALDVGAAFLLFTERISDWWPPERRHLGDPASVLVLDADRFLERASDGREAPLGRVRAWEPPRRVLLDFFPGTDPEHPTAVEVRFVPEAGGTRVVVHHTPIDASRALWRDRAPRYVRSWDLCLAALELASR